jgi:segregation and condensation protein B
MSNKSKTPNKDNVSLIEDPYGLTTLEIAEAQKQLDELDLDSVDEGVETGDFKAADLDESELKKLEEALAEEGQKFKETLKTLARDSSEELAAQIAEDQALEAQLKHEEEEESSEDAAELRAALPQSALDLEEIQSCCEALLFISDKPLSQNKLRDLLGPDFPLSAFQEALTSLADRYKQPQHGIELVEVAGGYQFRTKPGRAPLARKLSKVQTQRLSSGAMESLAIVAYKQPVMKEDIDQIRGVDSSYFIRGLLDKKLIRISGRSELPGRPMLYETTDEFLQVFGLKDLAALPPLRELEAMVPASQSEQSEDPRVKQLRSMVSEMNADTSTSLIYDPREDEKILQEMRERVQSIPISTPSLEQQRLAEKQAVAERLGQLDLAAQVEVAPTSEPEKST